MPWDQVISKIEITTTDTFPTINIASPICITKANKIHTSIFTIQISKSIVLFI